MGNPLDRLVTQQQRPNPLDAIVSQARPESPEGKTAEDYQREILTPWADLGRTFVSTLQQAPTAIWRALATPHYSEEYRNRTQTQVHAAELIGHRIGSAAEALGILVNAYQGNAVAGQQVAQKTGQLVENLSNTFSSMISEGVHDPISAYASAQGLIPTFTEGALRMGTEAIEAATGMPVGRFAEVGPLTAYEQSQAALNTLGNIAAIPLGVGVSKVLGTAAPELTAALASGMTPEALAVAQPALAASTMNLGAQAAILSTRERLLHGAVGGLVGGATYGAFEGLGEPDMVDKMVNYGLVAMPLGVASEFMFGTKINTDRLSFIRGLQQVGTDNYFNAARAQGLDRLRRLNLHETQNLGDVLGAMAALDDTRNLTRAVLNKTLTMPSRVVLSSVDAETAILARYAMEASDYSRLRSFGMSADDARTVSNIRRGLAEGEFSSERPNETLNLGPLPELTIDKVIAKARIADKPIIASVIQDLIGGSVVRALQFHGSPHIGPIDRLIPSEAGVHVGTVDAANKRLGFGPVSQAQNGQILPHFINVKKPIHLTDTGFFGSWKTIEEIGRITGLDKSGQAQLETRMNEAFADFRKQNPAPTYDTPERPLWDARLKEAKTRPLIEYLESQGYDAIEYINAYEDIGSKSYAVFNPDNIFYLDDILKSVTAESPSEKFKAIMDLRELYDFYPNDFSAKSNIPSFAVHTKPDGTFDIAFSSGMESFNEGQLIRFGKTGWMQGEGVNYRGKPAILDAIIGEERAELQAINKIAKSIGVELPDVGKVQARIRTANGLELVNLDEITRMAEPIANLKLQASELVFDKFIERNFKQPARTVANSKLVDAVPVRQYKILKRFEKAAPKYGRFGVNFESDFDRATYMAYSKNADGKRNATILRNHLKETTGLTDAELREHRDAVLANIRDVTNQASSETRVTLPRVVTKLESVKRAIQVAEVAESVPTKSWNQMVKDFAEQEGYNPTDIPDLSRQLSGRFMRDVSEHQMNQMNELELKTYKQVQQTVTDMLREPQGEIDNLGKLDRTTRANGQYIEHLPGAIVVRDVMTGRELYRGKSVSDVLKMHQKTGATRGIDGDGGNNGIGVPPVDAIPPSGNPSPGPFRRQDNPDNFFQKIRNVADGFRSFTKRADFFSQMERDFKIPLFNELYTTVQDAAMTVGGQYRKLMHPVALLEAQKLSAEERLLVSDYLETYSADDIRTQGFYEGRPASPIENALGTELGSNSAMDIRKVANYVAILDRSYATMTPQDFAIRMSKAATELQMNADELRFVEKLKSSGPVNHGTTYALAQATRGDVMGTPFLTREQFAKDRNMSPKLLKFAKEVETQFASLGDEFGVPKEFRIRSYLTHKRMYGVDDYTLFGKDGALGNINDTAYFKLNRNGLLQEYERDPLYALAGYIRAGLNEKYLTPAVEKAVGYLDKNLVKETLGAEYQYVRDNFEGYVRDIRGIPDDATQAFNKRMQGTLERLGLGNDMRRVVSTLNGWTDTAYQGASIFAAVRDIFTGWAKTSSAFGFVDAQQILHKGANELIKKTKGQPNLIDELADKGIIKTQGISSLETADQAGASFSNVESSGLIRGAERVARVGLKTSGQPLVFEMLQAGTYQHVWESVGHDLALWRKGELSQRQVFNRNSFQFYDEAMTNEFNRFVEAGQDQQATEYMAKEAVGLITGRYGHGNSPYGWTSWWMRLMGQYGQYTTDHKSFVLRGLSQGTTGQRAAFGARYAAINGALLAAGYYTGTNIFWRFAPITGFGYSGSPAMTLVQSMTSSFQNQSGFSNGVDYLEDILPYNSQGWNLDHPHGWLPFSKAITDYNRALWMIADDRGSGVQQALIPLGIKPSN